MAKHDPGGGIADFRRAVQQAGRQRDAEAGRRARR
jgi:hypothetical protein